MAAAGLAVPATAPRRKTGVRTIKDIDSIVTIYQEMRDAEPG